MDTLNRQTVMGLLFAIGVGVALAVSLNNVAIGSSVGTALFAAFVMRRKKKEE